VGHVRQKMEEDIQKQKWLKGQFQHKTGSSPAKDKSQYLIALGGIAAGLTIAVIILLAMSIVTKDHNNMLGAESDNAIHTGELRKPSDDIAMLNERVKSLTESVYKLEAELTHIKKLTDSIAIVETDHASATPQQGSESVDASSAFDSNDSTTSTVMGNTQESGKTFIPTHTVNTRVNLRPTASLNTKPIAVLNIGTKVEFISKSDNWYYVNTQSHGKGWCSSKYLSKLSPMQQIFPTN
jgi:hypothetical protein